MADKYTRMPSRPDRDDTNPDISALLRAMRSGDAQTLDRILSSNTNLIYTVLEPHGDSLLTKASQEGHGSIVDVLVRRRADPNLKRQDGWTPLQLAASLNHTSVLERLIDAGASVNAKNRDGWTALMLASQNDHAEATRMLINGGALLEIEDKRGNTALMLSAQYGGIQPLRLLLRAGAKTDHFNTSGLNSLMLAAISGRVDSVQSILSANVGINTKNQSGHTVLMVAASNGRSAVVSLLLSKKAAIDITDNNGWTALMHAASQWHVGVVEALLKLRADPHVTSLHRDTALRLAEAQERKLPPLGDVTLKPRVRDLAKERERTIELLTAALGAVVQRGKHAPAPPAIRSSQQPSPQTLAALPRATNGPRTGAGPKGGERDGKGSWGDDERSETMSHASVESGSRELCKKSMSSAEVLHTHVLTKHIQRLRSSQDKWTCPFPHDGHSPLFSTEKQLSFHLHSHTKAHIYRCRKCGTCLMPHGTTHHCVPVAWSPAVTPVAASKGPSQTAFPSISNPSSAVSIPEPSNKKITGKPIPKSQNTLSDNTPKQPLPMPPPENRTPSNQPSPYSKSEEQVASEWTDMESENGYENTGQHGLEVYMNGHENTENGANTGNAALGCQYPETPAPVVPVKETRSIEVQTDDINWTVLEDGNPAANQKEEIESEAKPEKPVDPFWAQLAQGGEQLFGSMDTRSQSLIVYLVQEVMTRDKLLKEREERLVRVSQSVMDVLRIDPALSSPLQDVLNALLEKQPE